MGRRTLEMAPPGIIRRGRPKQRWIDCVKPDTRAIGAAEKDVHDRTGWRRIVERPHNNVGTARRRRTAHLARVIYRCVDNCYTHPGPVFWTPMLGDRASYALRKLLTRQELGFVLICFAPEGGQHTDSDMLIQRSLLGGPTEPPFRLADIPPPAFFRRSE